MLSTFLQKYDVFFLDLDGLLVDTEPVHYHAFLSTGKTFGYDFPLDFSLYLELVSVGRAALKSFLCERFSDLEKVWETLYHEKGNFYTSLLPTHPIDFMPGAENFLKELFKAGKKTVVVTNSSREMAKVLKSKLSALQEIDHWVVREEYNLPKPAPDSYIKAKELYLGKGQTAVGFEDSIKGIEALLKASVPGVLVNARALIREQAKGKDVLVLTSLEETVSSS